MEDMAVPDCCVFCGTILRWPRQSRLPVCEECPLPAPLSAADRCVRCSRPLISEMEVCTTCRSREFAFDEHFAPLRYRGRSREIIQNYKFRGRRDLVWHFSNLLSDVYQERYAGSPLVPVPARNNAARKRGFDPVGLLVRRMASQTGAARHNLLLRSGGKSQKTLDYGERIANLNGHIHIRQRAFRRLERSAGPGRSGLPDRIVLVDDVFTTGATAHECARVLKSAGIPVVVVLTIAMD